MPFTKDHFPFKRELSLDLLLRFWEEAVNAPESPLSKLASHILGEVNDLTFLKGPIHDLDVLDGHWDSLALLFSALFPPAQCDRQLTAVMAPFGDHPIYESQAFRELDLFGLRKSESEKNNAHELINLKSDMMTLGRNMYAYHWIVRDVYERDAPFGIPVVLPFLDPQTGLEAYYHLDFDQKFTTVRVEGEKPELTEEQYVQLLDNPFDMDLWRKTLPPENFVFSGFIPISATNITRQEVLSQLKNDLLQTTVVTSAEFVAQAQKRMRSFLGCPELELGIVGLGAGTTQKTVGAFAIGRSLLLRADTPDCPQRSRSIYEQATRMNEPLVIKDLATIDQPTQFEKFLLRQGHRSVVLVPLIDEKGVLGMLELATPNPGELNTQRIVDLVDVIMLFTVAIKQGLDKAQDRIQSVIKEQYTAIHPEVEWRFRAAAANFIERVDKGEETTPEPIVFEDVYPLYGLADIRNSSVVRSAAIQDDMQEHLALADSVLETALSVRYMPAVDEVRHRLQVLSSDVGAEFNSGSEVGILEFLRRDVESLFGVLEPFGKPVREAIARYRDAMDPDLGLVYRRRKDFETSLTRITSAISNFVDEKQASAQKMFPHFFEKYKTDGVDYNIYVGQSLVADQKFDPMYLHNLRIWQLMLTCGVEWELARIKPTLEIAMDVTHLILVHDTPLDIRYRLDEKRFDVDGAYNIRYEIIKKRIDKAVIRNTNERLTQPGKLAIVYSQEQEAIEYLRYIEFLQSTGYLKDDTETLELTDYQGARGLMAIRVGIAPRKPEVSGDGLSTMDPATVADLTLRQTAVKG